MIVAGAKMDRVESPQGAPERIVGIGGRCVGRPVGRAAFGALAKNGIT
jgi:hypothetical protein